MLISEHTAQQQSLLFQLYETLNIEQQKLLLVLAVVYKPLSRGHINQLCRKLSNQTQIDWPANLLRLSNPDIEVLAQSGLFSAKDDIHKVNPLLANKLTELSIKQGSFLPILKLAEDVVPVLQLYDWEKTFQDEQRLARDYFYLKEFKSLEKHLLLDKNPQIIDHKRNQILLECCFMPFNESSFAELPETIQYQAFATWLELRKQKGASLSYPLNLLKNVLQHCKFLPLKLLYSEHLVLLGEFEQAEALLEGEAKSVYHRQLLATIGLFKGSVNVSVDEFEQAIKLKNKLYGKKSDYLFGVFGLFQKFALLLQGADDQPSKLTKLIELCKQQKHNKHSDSFDKLIASIFVELTQAIQKAEPAYLHDLINNIKHSAFSENIVALLTLFAQHWTAKTTNLNKEQINTLVSNFELGELTLFANLARQLRHESTPLSINFTQSVKAKPRWDRALSQLKALTNLSQLDTAQSNNGERFIWELHFADEHSYFTARIQTRSAQGWSKGKPISAKRLVESSSSLNCLTVKDKTIIQAIEKLAFEDYRGTDTQYQLTGLKALRALKGAPNIYLNDDFTMPISVSEHSPAVLIDKHQQEIHVSISHLPKSLECEAPVFSFYQMQSDEYGFSTFESEHLKVARIIREEGLVLPISAEEELLQSVQAIAPLIDIQSSLDNKSVADSQTSTTKPTTANNKLVINIQPYQEGLVFTCIVMPLGEEGPAFKPAIGAKHISALIKHERLTTSRDLAFEQELLERLDVLCPAFQTMADNQLKVSEPQDAYEVLLKLEDISKQEQASLPLLLRWPKGKTLSLSPELQTQHLQLAMYRQNEWFNLQGELQLDDDKVIAVKHLLQLAEQSSSRFIKLESDQVLCLSEQLKARLDTINMASENGQFHPLAGKVINEAMSGMRMKTLHSWEQQTQRMFEAEKLQPKLSPYLNADLRHYQIEGFKWAMKLAHWGAGACLADDMGLGKTLQALAVIQARASQGPTLIIAPTSVCFNWQQEAKKFTPTLSVFNFADNPTSEFVESLTGNECLIISYAMLQRHIDILKPVTWQTVVADEAQALKNPLSQRAQAACALKAEFRMITTGTPLENNLSELWSLFRFVNPGLLGNLKAFNRRFAQPIEQSDEDPIKAKKAAFGLKTLLSPFILRRLKSEVLTELPPRTHIDVHVPLNEQERHLYEAIRVNAVEKLAAIQKEQSIATQRMQIFAELTKLRQACSNPSLVSPDTDIESSKLKQLTLLLSELRENKHKALIFSQFIGSLQAVKALLEEQQIPFHYIDGATPAEQRKQSVNAFQRGEGEIFLISLKAGGSGLNLTAADYVIHLDPWWNPAVEAQASDRAHRIGQTKPVTVYRLVAEQTIEEKILALHEHKKELADKLLDDGNSIDALNVQELLGLLKETF